MLRRVPGGRFAPGRGPRAGLRPQVRSLMPPWSRLRLLPAAVLVPCLLAGAGWAETWRQARPGYRLQFPRDHASHPEYRIEWWYYTGNLADSSSRRFGFQLTFFRAGVRTRPENPSRWAVRDLFMAHLALSDLQTGRFHFAERLNRAGPGWAGASTRTYRVLERELGSRARQRRPPPAAGTGRGTSGSTWSWSPAANPSCTARPDSVKREPGRETPPTTIPSRGCPPEAASGLTAAISKSPA